MSSEGASTRTWLLIGGMAVLGGLITWFLLFIDRSGAFDDNYRLGYIPATSGQPELLWLVTEDIANSEDGDWLEGHHLILLDPATGKTAQDVYLEAPEEENDLPSNMKIQFTGSRFYLVHPPEFVQGKYGFAHVVDLKPGPLLEVLPESGKPWAALKGPVYFDRNYRGDTVLLLTDKLNEPHCLNMRTGMMKDGNCDVFWGRKGWDDYAWETILATSGSIRSNLWYWGQDSAYRAPEGPVQQYEEITITINDGMREVVQRMDPDGKMHTDTTMQVRKYNPWAGWTVSAYLNEHINIHDTSIIPTLMQIRAPYDTLQRVGSQDWYNARIIWCNRTAALVLHEDIDARDPVRISCVGVNGMVRWILSPEFLPLLKDFGSGEDRKSTQSVDWVVYEEGSQYVITIGAMAAIKVDAMTGKAIWSKVF